jgi:aryl-alcohol dehydrogenase-like predicted oxidoreductase
VIILKMAQRTINGRPVNPIGLGCMSLSWAYGTPPSDEEGGKLLNRAIDVGYNHLDTARIYGLGHNETLIGNALKGRRQHFFLASKTGIVVEGKARRIDCKPDTIRAACDESLRLLQTDHIDLYYLHRRDFTVPIEESVGALAELVKAGKIGGIGLSEMSAETLRKAAAVHPIAAMQTEYSPQTRNPELGVLAACKDVGTTFVAFSPVGRGALCGTLRDPASLPESDLRRTWPRFTGENWDANLRQIDAFGQIAQDAGVSAAQLALGWVLAQGDHVVTIPGTASIPHLEENIARHDWIAPPEVCAKVDGLINHNTVSGPRYPSAMQATIDTEEF